MNLKKWTAIWAVSNGVPNLKTLSLNQNMADNAIYLQNKKTNF